jgi:hypothetical protein
MPLPPEEYEWEEPVWPLMVGGLAIILACGAVSYGVYLSDGGAYTPAEIARRVGLINSAGPDADQNSLSPITDNLPAVNARFVQHSMTIGIV